MKEKKFTAEKIIKELEKKGYIEIYPICDECSLEVIYEVLMNFTSPNFNFEQVEDLLYCLKISV